MVDFGVGCAVGGPSGSRRRGSGRRPRSDAAWVMILVVKEGTVALEDLEGVESPAIAEPLLGETAKWVAEVPRVAKAGLGAAALVVAVGAWTAVGVAEDAWLVEYYPNSALSGSWTRQERWDRSDFASHEWLSGHLVDREDFSLRLHGCLHVRSTGVYFFRTSADDGARLYVDDRLVVDAWRQRRTVQGAPIELPSGKHRLKVEYANRSGGAVLRIEVASRGIHGFRSLEGVGEGLVSWEECGNL